MKILYIDPWCADGSNLYYYSTGLAGALSRKSDVMVACQFNCKTPNNVLYEMKKVFFEKSFHMKDGKWRKLIRGIEYIKGYQKILKLVKQQSFDVIHIEWLLLYSVDILLLKTLKKNCKLLSLKAHNILPHSTEEHYLKKFEKLYSIPDVIFVHGENLKEEFKYYFPQYAFKIRIQNHGVYLNHDTSFNEKIIQKNIGSLIEKTSRVYLFVGYIHRDKGCDRLAKIWKDSFSNSRSLLIIAGKANNIEDYTLVNKNVSDLKNVLFINDFIDDNLLNYLIYHCNLIILPYRKGSMSGVAFTAAEFSKPILCTKFGAIEEYINNGINGFIVDNNDDEMEAMLKNIDTNISNETLAQMGIELHMHFLNNYSWDSIGDKLVSDVYLPMLKEKYGN